MAIASATPDSIETRRSWLVAWIALTILSLSYGAPLVAVVALKPIAAELDTARSAPAIAGSLAYLGSGLGGILMGWLAERIGVRAVVMSGSVMVCLGLYVASSGGLTSLYVGYGLLVGLVGTSGSPKTSAPSSPSPAGAGVSTWKADEIRPDGCM